MVNSANSRPLIRRVTLECFRGFRDFSWLPSPGMNVVLGGGNAGKSTILDAIALLFHPSNSYTLSDADYWQRDVDSGFVVEAVMFLPKSSGIHNISTVAWPWEWDEEQMNAVQPTTDGDGSSREPVYKIRMRGTSDLELLYEILQPDGTSIHFPTSLRRNIGIVRLATDERSDRDLRMIQGGALDRLIADKGLRARLGRNVAIGTLDGELTPEARKRLTDLDSKFSERNLPDVLGLGFVGNAGTSINALVGLTSNSGGVPLPLCNWGSGTRRLAALAIADTLQDGSPLTVVDEVERGLEPYRQRSLIRALSNSGGQSFLTTHSATVISAAKGASLWYLDVHRTIGELPVAKVEGHQSKDPETFLARFTVVVEGATELGFTRTLLSRFVDESWEDLGLHVTDAGGNDNVLSLLEALSKGGLRFAGFADTEPSNPAPGKWAKIKTALGPLLLRWEKGCLEENILPHFDITRIEEWIADSEDQKTGQRRQTLAYRLEINDSSLDAIRLAAGDNLMQIVIEAATGYVPVEARADKDKKNIYKGHAKIWFKSVEGGVELAEKLIAHNVWGKVESHFDPFFTAIRATLDSTGAQQGGRHE